MARQGDKQEESQRGKERIYKGDEGQRYRREKRDRKGGERQIESKGVEKDRETEREGEMKTIVFLCVSLCFGRERHKKNIKP